MSSERSSREKDRYRSMCRGYRASLDPTVHAGLSDTIVRRALESGAFESREVIHVYWPIIERREIDTRPLIARLQEIGKHIVVPVVDSSGDPALRRMAYRLFTSAENMQENMWGTYEPIVGEAVPPERVDLVVAPALGADRAGFRLGYGGGFYDRFLNETECPALSLVYSACLFDFVPRDPHDVKVDLIVTEDELVRPGNLQPGSLRDRNY